MSPLINWIFSAFTILGEFGCFNKTAYNICKLTYLLRLSSSYQSQWWQRLHTKCATSLFTPSKTVTSSIGTNGLKTNPSYEQWNSNLLELTVLSSTDFLTWSDAATLCLKFYYFCHCHNTCGKFIAENSFWATRFNVWKTKKMFLPLSVTMAVKYLP